MAKQKKAKWEYWMTLLYFSLYFIIGLSLLYRQPFGNPPDEFNRYLIPQYIAEHGTIPNGYEESIRIPGYGFSYAFQPILPYMIQGYFMRFVKLFTSGEDILFYSARLVDFAFGLVMAVFVLLLGRRWFQDMRLQYLFCFLTMFLPQSIFIHTYVNTDSCCMMSIAIMLYGLTCCLQDQFAYPSCITMSIGIIFCALSYYNAYGFILSCILLFIANYFSIQNGKIHLDWKPFLQKGIFISAIVLLGIGWWFIRSYILYDGDFLGLRTRDACGALFGNADMKPDVKITYKSLGYTVPQMLLNSDFLILTINSFISMYGPMNVRTAIWIYRFYKLLFLATLPCLVPSAPKGSRDSLRPDSMGTALFADRPALRIFFHGNMVFCILMPCILSLIYSYNIDYQPQGRYIMPILIPLGYYCIRGMEKGISILQHLARRLNIPKKPASKDLGDTLLTGLFVCVVILIVISLSVTVYGYAFPYYAGLQAQGL